MRPAGAALVALNQRAATVSAIVGTRLSIQIVRNHTVNGTVPPVPHFLVVHPAGWSLGPYPAPAMREVLDGIALSPKAAA